MIETEVTVGTGLRITASKDELVQALGVVARAVSTRTSVQILSGILLEAQGSELRLAATDMELSLRATVPAQIEGDDDFGHRHRLRGGQAEDVLLVVEGHRHPGGAVAVKVSADIRCRLRSVRAAPPRRRAASPDRLLLR